MGGMAASLSVLVQAKGIQQVTKDLRSVDSNLRRTAGAAGRTARDLEDTGKRGSKSLGLLKKAAGALGAIGIGLGLAKGLRMATDEFEEARKVGALTESVIKSTGGSARITAKQVGELSMSISKKVGIDDEAIQSGANLLLTFKNIRNETGRGRDIFNQATAAAVDLSAAGFGSLSSTSKQLGKALNDPIKGMTALGRSGVTFSEDQKKAIEALMATGKASDRLKAQQIILKEVQSQVGGAAAAQATPMDKLRVTMGNLAEAAGAVLVPMLDKGAKFLTKFVGGMIESKGAGGAVIDVFKTTGTVIGTVVRAVADIIGWFREHKTVTYALAAAMSVLVAAFIAFKVQAAIQALVAGVTGAFWALNAAMAANPIGLVVIAIAALVAGLVVAYRESETFRKIVDAAFKGAAEAFGWLLGAAQDVFAWIKNNWPLLLAILTGPIGLAVVAIKEFGPQMMAAAKWLLDQFVSGSKAALTAVVALGGWVVARVVEGIKAITGFAADVGGWLKNRLVEGVQANVSFFTGLGGWVLSRIVEGFKIIGEALSSVGGWLKNRIVENVQLAVEGFTSLGGWVLNRIIEGFKIVTEALSSVGGWLKNRLVEGFTTIKDAFMGIGGSIMGWIVDGLKGGANLLVDFINKIIDVINLIPEVDIGHIKGFAEGGVTGGGGGPNGTGRLARGGAFGMTGGLVNHPITLMGEEAPRHPEYVIPTNPAYRNRAVGLLGQAAGAIGLAQGGRYSVGDMAKLAQGVGADVPKIMGAIGMAESSGDPHANGPPDGRGLWQIEWPVWAGTMQQRGLNNAYDPNQNARMMKVVQDMQGLQAWVVYNTGVYKQFLDGGDGGGILSKITGALGDLLSKGAGFLLDKLPGVGDLPDWLKGTGKYVLGAAGDFIKDKVGNLLSSVTGGNAGAELPAGVSSDIADVIALAQSRGFARPSVGQLTGGKHAAGSYHYQGRAADFGDAGHSAKEMLGLFNAIEARYGAHLKELFYDKAGHYVKNGQAVSGQFGGHGDHVHAALAQGGIHGGLLGSYASGTDWVPRDGAYGLHRGEAVIPAGQNARGATVEDLIAALRDMDVTFMVGGQVIEEKVEIVVERKNRASKATWNAGIR